MSSSIYLFIYTLSMLTSLGIGLYAWRQRHISGANWFALKSVAQALWTGFYILELVSHGVGPKMFWDDVQFFPLLLVPTTWLLFSWDYVGHPLAKARWPKITLAVLVVGLSMLNYTSAFHTLVRGPAELQEADPFGLLYYDLGPAYSFILLYAYSITLYNFWLLGRELFAAQRIYRFQVAIILLGTAIPIIGTIMGLSMGITIAGQRDFSPVTFGLANLLIAFGLFQFRLFDLVPVARETVVENMTSAMFVLDTQDRIVDLNPAAEKLISRNRTESFGQPLDAILPEPLTPLNQSQDHQQAEVTISNQVMQSVFSPIKDHADQNIGRLLVIQDITDQARARMQAEIAAELTNSITTAQSEQELLAAFTTIAASDMPKQSMLIYINSDDTHKPIALDIVAVQDEAGQPHPLNELATTHYTPDQFPLLQNLFATNQPLYVEDHAKDPRLGEAEKTFIAEMQLSTFVIVPLKSGGQWHALLIFLWDAPHRFSSELQSLIAFLTPRLADNIAARRAFLLTEETRKEIEVLYSVSQKINAATSFEQILQSMVDGIGPQDYSISLSIFEGFNFDTATYVETTATINAGDLVVTPQEIRLPIDPRVTGDYLIEDITAPDVDPELQAFFKGFGVQGICSVGIRIGGRQMGSLTFAATKPRIFTTAERNLLRGLAELIASATERSRLFAEQVKLVEELRALDAMKSQFLASMSHELRTPLNAILNFTEFMLIGMLGPINEKQQDALDKTLSSGKHLLALINDVLDMTKIQSGMMNLFVEDDVNLNKEIATVTSTVGAMLKDKPVQFVADIDDPLPVIVGDKRRIRQILLNLLSNACKFTETGTITLSVKHKGPEIQCIVSDTGSGIAPEDYDLIFEPFRQTSTGLQQAGGTGLGLPISRKLAESHGGQLWVQSTPGKGATFYVTLPVRSDALLNMMKLPEETLPHV